MSSKSFRLPYAPAGKDLILPDRKVIVISFFGKTPYSSSGCKADIIDGLIGRQVFHSSVLDDPKVDSSLWGLLPVWSDVKYRYAKALLFLFAVSHVLVLYHPVHIFDTSYLHLFRALDAVRQKAQPSLGELLRTIPGLAKEWANNGRPCSPRVLFFFDSCPATFREDARGNRMATARAGVGTKPQAKTPSIKKLEHALEDQIYHILRKSRVITNSSCNSLFAIPANLEFVFVRTRADASSDVMSYMMKSLIEFCNNPVGDVNGVLKDSMNSLSLNETPGVNSHSFKTFLQKHIDQAFTKGFDDNVGKHYTPGYFETPTSSLWYEVANKLYNFFLLDAQEKPKIMSTLHSLLDTDVRFSEGRCGKVLPLATATYQENLPTHYTRDYHETRLAHALSVFAEHARGPVFEQFAIQLEKDCDRHWKAGRQMCEVLSLTGNPCTNPIHRGGGEGAGGGELQNEARAAEEGDTTLEKPDRTQLPITEHSSGVRYVSACNCGRKQGPREDPFSVRAANYEFYRLLAEECGCNKLESIHFPVFQPSTQDYRAAQLFSNGAGTSRKDSMVRSLEGKELAVSTPQGNTQGFSLAGFVSGQSAGSDIIQEDGPSRLSPHPAREHTPDGHEVIIQVSDADIDNDKSLVRQPSTTEYLPGMLHTESPAGLLPQFPSWSLVCLGPSSLYSHNLGLQDQQQAGLLGGSAYLLPWDVTVRLEHQRDRGNSWPTVGDSYGRSKGGMNQHQLRGRKTKGGNKDLSEFVVKIFVGVEYECPRGHRFMCSAPDKVLKTTGSGLVKDNGNKVTGSDMPLYFPCPCRSAKPLVAQMMRIHVVTPKAPIHVTLNPRVQPAPAPCPVFVTGCEQPLRLSQSAYWVLRLPYVYVGEHGPYISPKEPVPLSYGRLLAGVYGITEVAPDEK
ncbi:nonsense-mediated mRNA decay factor SMG8 isoform X2 [Anabrus simplex]|uniref:nonsense-mediated mRNA decay factor SMG8 isoform X2 n=1 Tax=Anabrus simplex TaxID=316456 RepID=UPI0035A38D6C